jgi:hypothetical protein
MQAQDIIDEVSGQLNDTGFITWTEADLLRYITSAQEMIVTMRPDAYSLVTTMLLAVGTKQALPSTALRLLDIKRNMGTDGLTPGRPINAVEEDALDLFQIGVESNSAVTKDFSYDERTPNDFYVYPPSDGTGYIEMSISRIPPEVTANNQELALKNIYRNHIIQWCMFRAYSIEVDSASSQERAQEHESSFYQMLGVKFQRDVQFSPSVEVQQAGDVNGS